MSDVGISSIAGYLPRLRLSKKTVSSANSWLAPNLVGKGKGTRSMANWDEDSVTMAVEAVRRILGGNDDRSHVDTLFFASTTMPFVDRLNSGIMRAALTLEEETQCVDISSTLKSGTSALIQAIDKVKSGNSNYSIVSAADKRKTRSASSQELDFGDGSVAIAVDTKNLIAKYINSSSLSIDFVDNFRGPGEEFDYNWEERWVRDEGYLKIVPKAIKDLFTKANISG